MGKLLRDVLPHEALSGEYENSPVRRFLDTEVVIEHEGYQLRWPGPQRNVGTWWELANGWAVGWNENPSRGWSFPAVKMKKAYISSSSGELNITIIRNEHPEVNLSLDLGIPNFTVFSIKFPCVEDQPHGMREFILEGLRALLDEVSTFLLSLNFEEKVIVELYATILASFQGMTDETETTASLSDIKQDASVKTYEGTFRMPQNFVTEVHKKIVTGSGKVLHRVPPVRKLELTSLKPEKNDLNDVARVIRQYRNRSLTHQPKPLYVIVYDQRGRATGTLPLGNNFKNQLFKQLKGAAGAPDTTPPAVFQDEVALKTKNVQGIPAEIQIGAGHYYLEAYAGTDLALYKNMNVGTYSSPGYRFLVKVPDGRVVPFADRPTIKSLRDQNFQVPKEYWRWNLVKEESESSIEPQETNSETEAAGTSE